MPYKFASIIKKDVNFLVNLEIGRIEEINLFGSCSSKERIVVNMKRDKIVLWKKGEYTDEYLDLTSEMASNALQLIDNLKTAVDNYILEHTER